MPVLDGSFEAFVTNLGKYNEGELVEIFVFAKELAYLMNGAVIIGDEPFLIDLTEVSL